MARFTCTFIVEVTLPDPTDEKTPSSDPALEWANLMADATDEVDIKDDGALAEYIAYQHLMYNHPTYDPYITGEVWLTNTRTTIIKDG